MKLSIRNLLIALVAVALLAPACKRDAEPEAPAAAEETAEAEEAAEEAGEEAAAEEEETAEGAAEIDEDMYVKAAFEVACVRAHIDDPARSKEIQTEVYPRYGFTEESFKEAQEAMKGQDTVSLAVTSRMERCTAELAGGLAEAGAPETEAEAAEGETEAAADDTKAEAKKAAPKPKPAATGTFHDRGVSGGGFEDSQLRLNIRDNFQVSGEFRGKREGVNFIVPVSGTVAPDNTITAKGERGGNSVNISGRVTPQGASGSLTGSVHQKNYNVRYNAR